MGKPECSTCHRLIPDGLLACRDCTLDRSRAALFDYQRAPLRRVLEEGGELVVRHVGASRHVQMFGGYDFTFCTLRIPDTAHRTRVIVGSDAVKQLCADCQLEMARVLKAAYD